MERAQKAAVVGHPLGHTMSPFIHRRLFALQGRPLEYSVLDLPDLEAGMERLRGLDCFNVTIPYKGAVIPYLDEIDEKARVFGSVNTVKVTEGKLTGYTTDGAGCVLALQDHGLELSGELLLLGNGGAARAIAFEIASRQKGFRLTMVCREGSFEKAKSLCEEIGAFAKSRGDRTHRIELLTYEALEAAVRAPEGAPRFGLLLNTTSVGMYPHEGESPVSRQVTACCGAVFDAVYNPAETALLRLAREAGAETVSGLEMLVYQAAAAHEIWYGARFSREDITALCRDAEKEMDRLFERNGEENEG